MHIHILGICGKFMSGLAVIARQMGHQVSGSDQNLLPHVCQQLSQHDIVINQGYEIDNLIPLPDIVIIGNALARGVPVIEYILDNNIPYYSGPEWLSKFVLATRWVLAVSGTHGKTTTTSMLTWILDQAGFDPGYLIGGQAKNFTDTAHYSDSNFFVIEADEYDTAFFDKRSKFVHYHPKTLIINNLEFDHADIFSDLAAIQQQFTHLLRLVPSQGLVIIPDQSETIQTVLKKGCWTPVVTFGSDASHWGFSNCSEDYSQFDVCYQQEVMGTIRWPLLGIHNILNALAAIAAAQHVGILPQQAIKALNTFLGVSKRLELKGVINGVSVYDDFAHHPTAISATLSALRARVLKDRIFAVIEFGSHTMRSGYHQNNMHHIFNSADQVLLLQPKNHDWIHAVASSNTMTVTVYESVTEIIEVLAKQCRAGDHVLFMSNLYFDNIQERFMKKLTGEE